MFPALCNVNKTFFPIDGILTVVDKFVIKTEKAKPKLL